MTWQFTPSRNKINRNYSFLKTFVNFPYHPYFHICYLLTSQLYQIANPFYTYLEISLISSGWTIWYFLDLRTHTSVLAICGMFYKKIWKMLGFNQFTWSMIATSNHKREPVKTTSSLWSRQKTFNNLLTCTAAIDVTTLIFGPTLAKPLFKNKSKKSITKTSPTSFFGLI